MRKQKRVYILVLSGPAEAAQRVVALHYPDCTSRLVSKGTFREASWMGKLRELRKLRGEALLIFTESLSQINQLELLRCAGLAHRCRETVFADAAGNLQVFTKWQLLWQVPKFLLCGFVDGLVFLASWLSLSVLARWMAKPVRGRADRKAAMDVAFLYPFPFQKVVPGGEMSYLAGTLAGLVEESARCEVFSGCKLPIDLFQVHVVPNRRRLYLFREAQALSYNLRFAFTVARLLLRHRPRFLYQRHGPFVLVGVLLSRLLRIPLVLEYQCSEFWRATNWDPCHFKALLRLCEDLTITAASHFVVLSEALREELIRRGVPRQDIVLNPAAVEPERFRPGCGGSIVRDRLGFAPENVVVCFVGSFSYWHGIAVLQKGITRLMDRRKENLMLHNLRFLLVGDGPLQPEIKEALLSSSGSDAIVFTGTIPHETVPSYLDAADILVSPHVPLPDGQPFFGSPSKLFEYMAMGKAIVASDMDQLSAVLSHGNTAWLVPPGNELELSNAIELLAANPDLRAKLGRSARVTALERHTWRQNAVHLLEKFPHGSGPVFVSSPLKSSHFGERGD